MRYFIGGFSWKNKSQLERFIEDGIWENGYEEEKYAELFSQISVGDMFALKSTFVKGKKPNAKSCLRIKQLGIVTNIISKSSITINWIKDDEFDLTDIKWYANTLEEINTIKDIERIFGTAKKGYIMENYIALLKSNKNLILTGAPGTGKTFLAKQIAKQMIGVQTDEELEKSAQFAFVQFHPSYDYTDFVEGLRPLKKDNGELGFELRDGVFKKFCKDAQKNINDSGKTEQELKKEEIALNNIFEFLNQCIDNEEELELTTGNKFTVTEFNDTHIIINAPNNAITSVLTLPLKELFLLLLDGNALTKVNEVRNRFNRSHNRQNDSYIFSLYNSRILNKELKSSTIFEKVKKKNFVFVIDEINRGEISKIFGELFFSIEPSYRGKKGAVKTQYSNLHDDDKEVFYVPENIYIIGSMNDIDRSVESFDFAMRRRFTWIEISAEQSAENMNLPRNKRKNGKIEQSNF